MAWCTSGTASLGSWVTHSTTELCRAVAGHLLTRDRPTLQRMATISEDGGAGGGLVDDAVQEGGFGRRRSCSGGWRGRCPRTQPGRRPGTQGCVDGGVEGGDEGTVQGLQGAISFQSFLRMLSEGHGRGVSYFSSGGSVRPSSLIDMCTP